MMTENDRNDDNEDNEKADIPPPAPPPPPPHHHHHRHHQHTDKIKAEGKNNEGVPKKDEDDDDGDVKTKESKDGKPGRASDGSDDGIPKDSGYSWVVCFSVSLLHMLVFGHNRALSTSFVDIREEFQQSQTVTSLALSVFALLLAVSSLIASNVIIKMFPPRVSCVCASICSVISVFVASQAPHIGVWILSYAFRGLSCGILLIIPMSLIGYYFKERRALASSLASMGAVVANIAFPPLATFLVETFGMRGAMLLLVGIELQMIPLSMLLRPYTSYTKRHKQREKLLTQATHHPTQHPTTTPTSSAASTTPTTQGFNTNNQFNPTHNALTEVQKKKQRR